VNAVAIIGFDYGEAKHFDIDMEQESDGRWIAKIPEISSMNQPSLAVEIDCRSVKAMLDAHEDFLLLDCREPSELEIVHMQAATSLPMSELEHRVAELDADRHRRVVVFCHLGMRSLNVAEWLRQRGFDRAQSMAGGIDAWAQQIEPDLRRY